MEKLKRCNKSFSIISRVKKKGGPETGG